MTILGIVLLTVILRLPSVEQPFDNDSGANAYHARLIARGEPLYGTHHPIHHMPAVYYTYVLAFRLLGDSAASVKLLLIPWTAATAYILYRLGFLLTDRPTGVLAAVLFAFLSSHVDLWGSTAEIELFANLPRIAALLVLLGLTMHGARSWRFAAVGLLAAFAFLYKAVYLSPMAMAGLVLVSSLWQRRKSVIACRKTLLRGIWIAAGFAFPLLLVAAYFRSQGLLSRLLLVFTLGTKYVAFRNTGSSPLLVLLYPFVALGHSNAAILITALAGTVTNLWQGLRGPWSSTSRSGISLLAPIWLMLSLAESGSTRVFFPHYFQLAIPPLALLSAAFILATFRALKRECSAKSKWVPLLVLTSVLLITLGISIERNWDYYSLYVQYWLGQRPYQDFVRHGWPVAGSEFVRTQKLADYVRGHTSSSDRVYYWSGAVQLYYLADRRCSIDMIWPMYVEAGGPYQRIFSQQTRYIILGESNNVPRPDWLRAELSNEYVLETTIEGQQVYRRLSD